MFKKMGRPSRKQIATSIMFEEPDGDIFLFRIDEQGQSHFCGNSHKNIVGKLHNKPESILKKAIPDSLNDNSKNIIKIKESSDDLYVEKLSNSLKYSVDMDLFDSFVSLLENNTNISNVIKDYKLSNSMLPFISI